MKFRFEFLIRVTPSFRSRIKENLTKVLLGNGVRKIIDKHQCVEQKSEWAVINGSAHVKVDGKLLSG